MHTSSYNLMAWFAKKYLKSDSLILDFGGSDINGSYRKIFEKRGATYKTLDWDKADYIINGYDWSHIPENTFDMVISGQAFEHDKFFWKTLENIKKILKPNGIVMIIVPTKGGFHRYPIDCYRFYADSAIPFSEILDAEILEVVWNSEKARDLVQMSAEHESYNLFKFSHQYDTDWGDLGMVFKLNQ